ncbi:hypothetical protein MAPG_10208 [Magnaporthiopsis poae ATCC 64411]|uniref:Uncharacterized protein n=1 Tax=Magnaporthiopsis poae (strain ATCC 64411 / 73-15) TaxID=644358 RepID=A0A0C4EBZ6_MAGP6|nr:hypothetical protein MAPG_10208 [Magnaporthiopsis poae ATCC 64411]
MTEMQRQRCADVAGAQRREPQQMPSADEDLWQSVDDCCCTYDHQASVPARVRESVAGFQDDFMPSSRRTVRAPCSSPSTYFGSAFDLQSSHVCPPARRPRDGCCAVGPGVSDRDIPGSLDARDSGPEGSDGPIFGSQSDAGLSYPYYRPEFRSNDPVSDLAIVPRFRGELAAGILPLPWSGTSSQPPAYKEMRRAAHGQKRDTFQLLKQAVNHHYLRSPSPVKKERRCAGDWLPLLQPGVAVLPCPPQPRGHDSQARAWTLEQPTMRLSVLTKALLAWAAGSGSLIQPALAHPGFKNMLQEIQNRVAEAGAQGEAQGSMDSTALIGDLTNIAETSLSPVGRSIRSLLTTPGGGGEPVVSTEAYEAAEALPEISSAQCKGDPFTSPDDGQQAWNAAFAREAVRLSLLGVGNINDMTECTRALPPAKEGKDRRR